MTIKLDFKTVKNLKQPGRYTDALVKGLHIWVKPSLNKYWIFRYTHQGKQHNISLARSGMAAAGGWIVRSWNLSGKPTK
jgi:hypothetical protein